MTRYYVETADLAHNYAHLVLEIDAQTNQDWILHSLLIEWEINPQADIYFNCFWPSYLKNNNSYSYFRTKFEEIRNMWAEEDD